MGLNANQSRRLEAIVVSLSNVVEELVKLINELGKEDKLLLVDLILSINHTLQKIRLVGRVDSVRYNLMTRFGPPAPIKKPEEDR